MFLKKNFLNNEFKAIIVVDNTGTLKGKIIDLSINEEYINIKTNMQGNFINNVRESYKKILIDINNHCFKQKYFLFDQTNRINKYIIDKYKSFPEFLWKKFPAYAVYRNNKKWFATIMNLDLSKIDNGSGEIEILNVKLNPSKISKLLKENGYYEAYHMNKLNWISIILNDTLKDDEIISLIDESFKLNQ